MDPIKPGTKVKYGMSLAMSKRIEMADIAFPPDDGEIAFPDDEAEVELEVNPLEYPEDYLWVWREDGAMTALSPAQLYNLMEGKFSRPSYPVLEQLRQHPEDISKILACMGNLVMSLSHDQVFPMTWNFDPREVY